MVFEYKGPEIKIGKEKKSIWKKGKEILLAAGVTAAGIALMLTVPGIGALAGKAIAGFGASKVFGEFLK